MAHAAGGGVDVYIDGAQRPVAVSAGQLRATDTPPGEQVTVRPGGDEPYRGVYAATVLRDAGLDPDHAASLSVRRGADAPVTLTGDEISSGFPNDPHGLRYATFETDYSGEPQVHFVRPPRDAFDRNGQDEVTSDPAGNMAVDVHTDGGARLSVTVSPAQVKVDPGQTVTLRASAAGQRSGAAVRFFWDFDDGSRATGAEVTHSYPAAGSYVVNVTAVGSDDSSGAAPAVPVQVGDPQGHGATTTPSGAPSAAAGGGSGGSGSGGGSPLGGGGGGAHAPAHGPARSRSRGDSGTPSSRPATGAAPRAGASPRRTATSAATARPSVTPPAASATAAGSGPSPPATRRPVGRTPGGAGAPRDQRRAQKPAAPATSVSGRELAGQGDPTAAALAVAGAIARDPGGRSAARAAAGEGSSPLGWIGGAVTVLALLGLGVARERAVLPRSPRPA